MSQSLEHNPLDHEDPLTGPTWIIGLLGTVLLIVIFFGLTAIHAGAVNETFQDQELEKEYPIVGMKAEQLRQISPPTPGRQPVQYRDDQGNMITLENRTVIPIDMAMAKIVEEANR